MYLTRKNSEKSNRDSLSRAAIEVKADVKNYIDCFFDNLENSDRELKIKISKSLVFREKQLTHYIKRVCDSINNLANLKKLFRLIGGKYLKSELTIADLTLLSNTFLQTLEMYLGSFDSLASKQKIYLIYNTILEEILEGAKDKHSLWHEQRENTFSCVKRMKVEAVIQRTLTISDGNEELVLYRLMHKAYFETSLEKIGKEKTLELIKVAIEIVNKKIAS